MPALRLIVAPLLAAGAALGAPQQQHTSAPSRSAPVDARAPPLQCNNASS
eukprot:COSAG04_NODE_19725_length_409_cov_1.300000_1_plen_49_part_10